jgi:hypothetical protein
MDLDQIEDSQLDDTSYTFFIQKQIKDKNYFKAALAYQEIVQQRYQTFYLQMFAESQLHNGRTSDNAVKIIKEFDDDIKKYAKLAQQYLGSKDKSCDPLATWPEEVLVDCNQEAERNGYGDEELDFCTCYDNDSKKLTRRKPGTRGAAATNFEKVSFKDGVPKRQIPNIMPEIGSCYRFSAINFPQYSINVRANGELWADQSSSSKSSVFKIVEANNQQVNDAVSMESVSKPGNFVYHRNAGTFVKENDSDAATLRGQTYFIRVNAQGTGVSFESSDFSRQFLRH